MDYTTLGRTGLKVSVAGLGCGGGSRLGLSRSASEDHSINIVHRALDLGINFLDTAKAYGTEAIVGKALRPIARDSVVVSTKHNVARDGTIFSAQQVVEGLEDSLRLLDTDYIDIYHLHGVAPRHYAFASQAIVPALLREKDKGKFRYLGITETAPNDPRHQTLSAALDDDHFDVVMLAYHMMNQNALELLFPRTKKQNVGTLVMFAVRSLFSVPGRLIGDMRELADAGKVPIWLVETDNPLGFLIHEGGAESIIDAAYRFVRHTSGTDVVLFGTGDFAHLETNLASILKPALPQEDVAKLRELFGSLEGVGLDLPGKL